jgi:hypothetical protein
MSGISIKMPDQTIQRLQIIRSRSGQTGFGQEAAHQGGRHYDDGLTLRLSAKRPTTGPASLTHSMQDQVFP